MQSAQDCVCDDVPEAFDRAPVTLPAPRAAPKVSTRISAGGTLPPSACEDAPMFVRYWTNSGQRWILARDGLSANDVVDGAYSAASKCDRLVALKAYRNVEGDDGLMRTGWTGDRENPLMGQALLSAG